MLFRIDTRSGVPPYLQIVDQVRRRIQYGELKAGDQLPTARELVAALALNPNTVLKAYRELEQMKLVALRPGLGTFVVDRLPPGLQAGMPPPALRRALQRWVRDAEAAGLSGDAVLSLVRHELDEADEASA
jgi:GntR family transcriptional regulator